MEKKCTRCGEAKDVAEFYAHPTGRGGVGGRCKVCRSVLAKAYYASHKAEVAARGRAYHVSHLAEKAAYNRAWAKANPEREATRHRVYHEANKEKIAAHYAANREKILARGKIYRDTNREKRRAMEASRRARENGAAGHATADQIQARWDYYFGLCYICGEPADQTDHVKPLAKGGAAWPCNLRPICKYHNSVKGAKWPYDFTSQHEVSPAVRQGSK